MNVFYILLRDFGEDASCVAMWRLARDTKHKTSRYTLKSYTSTLWCPKLHTFSEKEKHSFILCFEKNYISCKEKVLFLLYLY